MCVCPQCPLRSPIDSLIFPGLFRCVMATSNHSFKSSSEDLRGLWFLFLLSDLCHSALIGG